MAEYEEVEAFLDKNLTREPVMIERYVLPS